MPFECGKSSVQVVEVAGAASDLRTLLGDQLAQLTGHAFTVAVRTESSQLACAIEWKI